MVTEKYYSVSVEVAEKTGLLNDRYKIKGDRYILSGSDIKDAVMSGAITPTDFPTLDIIEVEEAEARALIAENGHEIGGEGGLPNNDESEETEDAVSEEEAAEEEISEEEISEEEPSDGEETVEEEPSEEQTDEVSEEVEQETQEE